MSQPARQKVEIRDWPGLVDNQDPHDVPLGAGEDQNNLVVLKQGEMRVRLGYKVVTFEA